MKTAFTFALFALAGGATLSTDYSKERVLKIESSVHVTSEVTEMTRDGEPIAGGMKSDSTWHVVQLDEVLEHEGLKPTKVKRTYEKVGGESSRTFGENESKNDLESPFEGSTLQLTADGEDVKVSFLEGKKPDHEGALDGHKLELALDALLPDKDVEKGAHWDLDAAQIKRALGLDLRKALYPPPPAPENAGGSGGGGGGRRGGMGRGGGMGGIPPNAEWTGKAKLVSLEEDVDGQKCAKIAIEIGAHGDLPEPQMGGGGRGRMLEPGSGLLPFASTYTIEAKGEFYVSLDGKHPVKLELEGTVGTESEREMKGRNDDATHKMHTRTEGKLTVKIEVGVEAAAKKDAKGK
jgi:hypothetical protein